MTRYLICCYSDPSTKGDAGKSLLGAVRIDSPARHVAESLVDEVRHLIQARLGLPNGLDCRVAVLSEPDAVVRWSPVDLALAQRSEELWQQEASSRPEATFHAFLRECGDVAKFLPAVATPAPKPTLRQRKEKAMKNTAEWMLTFARAVEILKKTFDESGIVVRYTELDRQLRKEGWNPETNRLNKDLSENMYIRSIVSQLKGRPPKNSAQKYADWRERFDSYVKFAYETLLKSDRDGMREKDLQAEYRVKKKRLAGLS